ncbi:MAG: hypothetical protein V4615_05735, partial [Bacteroidota bacterium]
MIGFGATLLIFGHYVDFFNYTFFEPNLNKTEQHHGGGHAAAGNTEKVVLYAEAETKANHEAAATTDATPVHENTEAVTTEVKHEAEAAQGHDRAGEVVLRIA